MPGKIRYAYLDEALVIFDDARAFHYVGRRWQPLHLAEAMSKARLMSKEDFDRHARCSGIPELPSTSFH